MIKIKDVKEIQEAIMNLTEVYDWIKVDGKNSYVFNTKEDAMKCFKEQLEILKSHIKNPYK